MIKKIQFFLFFFAAFCINTTFSQNNLKSIKDSIFNNIDVNPQKAKIYAQNFLKTARKLKDGKEESNAYYFLAELCGTISQKDSAVFYFRKAINKAEEINNQELVLNHKINKASYLFAEYDFNGSLLLFDECLKLAKKNDNKKAYDYVVNKRGSVYYEIGKYKEALSIFKESIKNKDFEKRTLLGIELSITKTYHKLNLPDSALIYSKKGIIEAKKSKFEELEMHFHHQEGLIYTFKKEYTTAEKAFDDALNLAIKDDFFEMKRLILINKSKLFSIKKESNKAISLLKEITINTENIPISTENMVEIDSLLAENYKATNNLELSTFHYQKCNEGQRKLNDKKIQTLDFLHKIDISEVKDESDNQAKWKWIFTAIALLLASGLVLLYFKKRKDDKESQKKFETLLFKIKEHEESQIKKEIIFEAPIPEEESIENDVFSNPEIDTIEEDIEVKNDFEVNNTFIIKDETISDVLEKLIKLEEKKYFLKQECTLHNVAKKLKTNTAYLSKIVNNELGKSFSTYINELRINYIVVELKNNAKLRSYSINAISEEIGYKSSESFTKYFKVATGITPAIYIKKINQLHQK